MFKASAAIAKFLRCKLHSVSGEIIVAGDEAFIGEIDQPALAAGDPVVVYDKRAPGSHIFVAGGAIAWGAQVTTAAAGKVVTGTGGVVDLGVCISPASGDGALVEVLPHNV